jgi:hypothetical protein
MGDDRCGSIATFWPGARHFWFAPNCGHPLGPSGCLKRADIVAKVENRTTLKNLAKVDLWTSLLLHRFSTPQRRPVIDFE